ncbi:PRC-barrel domain-containing protein [Leisingera daeponensis]|uniref:PRC-barrel domain-containing protein n=1 Tax=Leisingera daeponensis TaxID=405746 RepID=UPI001C95ABCB|nr:PRC-barrel domain-containing protein [Leisingera daeponensis]MBY6055923.1 PRC-barrel domain-containing protein [Leisingera daeponensis]
MRTLIKQIALVSVLTSAPAIALSQTAEPAEEPETSGQVGLETGAVEPTIAPIEGQIILQSENTILAKDLIGRTVFSHEGEVAGDINDMIINFDGTVEGVVVGVGGFLGIGEKEVAIELNKIKLGSRDDGSMLLILNATREELEASPEFKSARDQKIEFQTETSMQNLEDGLPPATEPEE